MTYGRHQQVFAPEKKLYRCSLQGLNTFTLLNWQRLLERMKNGSLSIERSTISLSGRDGRYAGSTGY
jgi:hypothetical protein